MAANKVHAARSPASFRAPGGEVQCFTRRELAGMPAEALQALILDLQERLAKLDHRCTDLRETQQQLAQACDHLVDLYLSAPVGCLSLAADGSILEANQTAAGMLGVSRQNLLGASIMPFVARADHDAFHRHRRDTLAGSSTPGCELTMLRADGSPLAVRIDSAASRDLPGHSLHCHSVLIDITERTRVRRTMRDRETQIPAILDAAADAVITSDREGNIQRVNPAATKLFNYSEDELLGRNVRLLLPPWEREEHDEHIRRYNRTHDPQIIGTGREVVACRKDGSTFPADLSISEVREFGLFIGIIRDISARREAEQALRDEHEFTSKIINTAQTVILVLDPEGRVVLFNPCFEKLSGWRLEDAKGLDWLTTFVPARNHPAISSDFKCAHGGDRIRGTIHPILTIDGSERLIEWHQSLLTNAEGAPTGLLCTGIDVTDRQMLEQKVINAAEEERRRTALDLHDGLGSLLTGIGLRTKALANDCAARHLAQATELNTIAELIRDAVKQVRGVARGLHPVGDNPDDLRSALDLLVTRTRVVTKARCRFRCNPPVRIRDPRTANHLFRIAQEALNNSVKHSGAAYITVSLARRDGRTTLKVTDNGVGFHPGQHHPGGLGLGTMHYRARAINATLTIRQRKEGGTTVSCSIASDG